MSSTIHPARVRYIKLGETGRWEKECIEQGIIRIGFGSAKADRFPLCAGGKWAELTQSFIASGRSKGTATRFTNETRLFFEDDGSTLWVTFVGERLYWGSLAPAAAKRHEDGDGVLRFVAGGWQCNDILGEPLTKDRLSGALTKLAAYRGTSCDVDVSEYVVGRINGQKTPEVERAIAAVADVTRSVIDLMRLLVPNDFELLVDLVFSTSGWRRLGVVGKTQKTLDLDLTLPTTGEKAFVQVKSKTSSAELAEYVAKIEDHGEYTRMFFVFHSGEAATDDERVTVVGPQELARMVVNAGLTNWLIEKVS
jgi:hypothetical protein